MKVNTKPRKVLALFIGLIVLSGLILMYKGYDPVEQAKIRKEGVLTAEQVKVAFDSVNGRLLKEAVKEGDHVKRGDVLMILDATDTELTIEHTKHQIAQLDAQIAAQAKSIDINYAKADTTEVKTYSQIDQQRDVIDSAYSNYQTRLSDYGRMKELVDEDMISQKEMDSYQNALDMAKADLSKAQNGLNQLLGGATYNGTTAGLVLPDIQEQRMDVDNQKNTLANLQEQKKQLETTLKQLEVNHGRLVLRAPEDGKILKVIAKEGEMITAGTPVILLESERTYYDIYLPEHLVNNLHEGDDINGYTIDGGTTVPGKVRLIARADGFTDYKMSREKSSADIVSFQVRIYTKPVEGIIPGRTIEVHTDEFLEK